MARFRADVTSYLDADKFLSGKEERKIAHNTTVRRIDSDFIAIRYHYTNVVVYHSDGGTWINSGGYHTTTTKQRINASLPLGWGVFAKSFEWFLSHRLSGETVEFFDGMPVKLAADLTQGDSEAFNALKLGKVVF